MARTSDTKLPADTVAELELAETALTLPQTNAVEKKHLSEELIDYNNMVLVSEDDAEEAGLDPNSKYFTHVQPRLEAVLLMRRRNFSHEKVASALGISCNTLKKYAMEYKELMDVLVAGRMDFLASVEKSLVDKTQDRIIPLTKHRVTKQGDVVSYTDEVFQPADMRAIEFVLTNHDPEQYGKKEEIHHTHELSIRKMLEEIGQEQLEAREKQRELQAPPSAAYLDPALMVQIPDEDVTIPAERKER